MVRIWFAKSKPNSCVNTIKKHVANMVKGVTKGFRYVMKYGYKILSMECVAVEEGKVLKVINYLGKNQPFKIRALDGVTIKIGDDETKKEIEINGIDPEAVGTTCALISQSCRPKNVDKRKFLDGIFIFKKTTQD